MKHGYVDIDHIAYTWACWPIIFDMICDLVHVERVDKRPDIDRWYISGNGIEDGVEYMFTVHGDTVNDNEIIKRVELNRAV